MPYMIKTKLVVSNLNFSNIRRSLIVRWLLYQHTTLHAGMCHTMNIALTNTYKHGNQSYPLNNVKQLIRYSEITAVWLHPSRIIKKDQKVGVCSHDMPAT